MTGNESTASKETGLMRRVTRLFTSSSITNNDRSRSRTSTSSVERGLPNMSASHLKSKSAQKISTYSTHLSEIGNNSTSTNFTGGFLVAAARSNTIRSASSTACCLYGGQSSNEAEVRFFPLKHGRTSIGSSRSNDISIRGAGIAPQHCYIESTWKKEANDNNNTSLDENTCIASNNQKIISNDVTSGQLESNDVVALASKNAIDDLTKKRERTWAIDGLLWPRRLASSRRKRKEKAVASAAQMNNNNNNDNKKSRRESLTILVPIAQLCAVDGVVVENPCKLNSGNDLKQ